MQVGPRKSQPIWNLFTKKYLDNLSIFDRHSWLMPGILFLTASILAIIIVITIRRIKLYTS